MQPILLVFALAFPVLHTSAQTAHPNTPAVIKENTSSELLQQLHAKFQKLEPQTISPAAGVIRRDYLIPAGYYRQMWDWDGFFIGMHFAHQSPTQAIYLKWWVQNFAQAVDADGYVSGCITPKGPRPLFGKFAMKPFLAQGAYFAAARLSDYTWVAPIWNKLQLVLAYRDRTQYDPKYGLYFWDNAMQSGGDGAQLLSSLRVGMMTRQWKIGPFN
jgi:alpha,alpha-trehalase